MTESTTPRTDALARDHYYESAAHAAGMIVSAKSPEDCYREAMDLARALEVSLSEESSKRERAERMLADFMSDCDALDWLAANGGSVRDRYNGSRILFSWNQADGDLRGRCLRDLIKAHIAEQAEAPK